MLTAERLRELLRYDPETGEFVRILGGQGTRLWRVMGWRRVDGYISVRADQASYLAHRLAWLYVHGEWPVQFIDHINGVKDDNRIENLREADRALNNENRRRARSDSKSNLIGAYRYADGAWRSNIMVGGKIHYLGYFKTPEAAHAAYLTAKRRLHKGCTL